ncbi:MAG: response regulator [Bacteroidota bacterium]|nr:response regulator [Bacteroidota bacterium]
MIKVLVIEDNPDKTKVVRNLLDKNKGIERYDVANDSLEARRLLELNFYDLLILDLKIPKRFGDDPLPENSINLLDELNKGGRLIRPSHIIGLTEFDKLKEKYDLQFEKFLWLIILYEVSSTAWEEQLNFKIDYLIKAKATMLQSAAENPQIDLAFITALRTPELDFVLKLPLEWSPFRIPNDSTEYHRATLKLYGRNYSFVAVAAIQMGMVAASTITMKVIHSFRPRYIVMTGIAAGIHGKSNFGDILISESAFDYTSGKTIKNENDSIFEPDYKPVALSRDLLEVVQACNGVRSFLDEIKAGWVSDNKISHSLEAHCGPIASGGSVIADDTVPAGIKMHARKLIGIDMETYGVYYAANNCSRPKPTAVISIKSVSDFANMQKSDNYQNYASYTSAAFAYRFFTEKIFKHENEDL